MTFVRPILRMTKAFACSLVLLCLSVQMASAQGQTASTSTQHGAPVDSKGVAEMEGSLKTFLDVLQVVKSSAADNNSVDKMIYEGAIPSMLRELDPHTQFFDPVQFQQLQQMEQSEQKGFGSIVSVLPGQVIFLQTLPGTPSNKAGIQPGDELVAIGNVAISPLMPEQIVELLTEARQQKVVIYVRRAESARPMAFTLTPELVDAPSVDRAYMLRDNIGYIRIASWDLQTTTQLKAALGKLSVDHLAGLVIDLRNNPGGIVQAALEAASMFLQPGQRILTAKGRSGEGQMVDAPKNAKPHSVKLAVVLNARTASASEILSGALQDHDRAVIVGLPSYGKGLVQSVMPLSGGAGLAITTAFYYTPSGRSIQKPLRNSALSETFQSTPSATQPTYKTDKGRTVLGGGGIQPDVVVAPAEPTRLEGVLEGSGAVIAFATRYHSQTPELKLPEDAAQFRVTPELLDQFRVFLSERNIQPSIAEWTQERAWISNKLSTEIVTQIAGVAKGEEIEAQQDPQIQAAIHALEDRSVLNASAR